MYRGRRLRKNSNIRNLMKEEYVKIEDFIYPLFIVEGTQLKESVPSMPDVYRYSLDKVDEILEEMISYGIQACLLFGIVKDKDACGSKAYQKDGIIQQCIRKIKKDYPQIYVIADVCMCEYTSHGHCGILNTNNEVDNDQTLHYLQKIALSYAEAGVDMVAPSDMMDGHIEAIRNILDQHHFTQVAIMGYSVKYASSFYGPFRDAANSTPSFGDRKSYQMDYANKKEAYLEVQADIQEGVDIVMVKPAMAYLDIIATISQTYPVPVSAYQVSGEYSMLKLAIQQNLISREAMLESLLAIKRAGAKLIISYEALNFAKELKDGDFYGTYKCK